MALRTLRYWRLVLLFAWWVMARAAISQSIVAERRIVPVVGVMALGTLPGKVVGRWGMAGLAIVQPIVAERRIAPVVGVMALGTLTAKMVGRPGMAGLAIR